ncbi:hypothetical protein FHR81_005603 [Actinoalloteichus hoggarensis]|uniref:Uncharacterized protein n=1 Tax=Actinoalloteichus hoggarensis TaxID=1470176 RepID=A0A221W896_9PSEU|nr:hypothetical protein [Actinoalloteichus hoggarensis]ASO21933.1 hypothetical protein AHOG_21585 [Actinoalloteichus hoggarensis]MBB5924518.1 hypothetical protein [Actinoalloteichus hoggarensis]
MLVAFGLVVLAGCGTQGAGVGVECTAIGARTGLGLDVAAGLAPDVAEARVLLCQDDECTETDMPADCGDDCGMDSLRPGSDTVDQGCVDGVCSASSVPDGTLHGFVDLPELAAGPAEVSVTLVDRAGAEILAETISLTVEDVYPNGPECGAGGVAAAVRVTDDHTLVEA